MFQNKRLILGFLAQDTVLCLPVGSVYNLLNSHIDLEGRFVLCCFSFRDITFNISCLYAPSRNPARNDFFEELADSTVL